MGNAPSSLPDGGKEDNLGIEAARSSATTTGVDDDTFASDHTDSSDDESDDEYADREMDDDDDDDDDSDDEGDTSTSSSSSTSSSRSSSSAVGLDEDSELSADATTPRTEELGGRVMGFSQFVTDQDLLLFDPTFQQTDQKATRTPLKKVKQKIKQSTSSSSKLSKKQKKRCRVSSKLCRTSETRSDELSPLNRQLVLLSKQLPQVPFHEVRLHFQLHCLRWRKSVKDQNPVAHRTLIERWFRAGKPGTACVNVFRRLWVVAAGKEYGTRETLSFFDTARTFLPMVYGSKDDLFEIFWLLMSSKMPIDMESDMITPSAMYDFFMDCLRLQETSSAIGPQPASDSSASSASLSSTTTTTSSSSSFSTTTTTSVNALPPFEDSLRSPVSNISTIHRRSDPHMSVEKLNPGALVNLFFGDQVGCAFEPYDTRYVSPLPETPLSLEPTSCADSPLTGPFLSKEALLDRLRHDQSYAACANSLLDLFDRWAAEFCAPLQVYDRVVRLCEAGQLPESYLLKRVSSRRGYRKRYFRLTYGQLLEYRSEKSDEKLRRCYSLLDGASVVNMDSGLLAFTLALPKLQLELKAPSLEVLRMWTFTLLIPQTESSLLPFGSFAPPRVDSTARWFVSGADYFAAVEDALLAAREHIFITDWFLSPEMYLRRDPAASFSHMLKNVLLSVASKGVQVYILLWKETKIAINLANLNAASLLESLSPNIRVICHPPSFPVNWSHHQKTVIVDQRIAFVGGLDFAFGRWDDIDYRVMDASHLTTKWPGKDYYNPRFKTFEACEKPFVDLLDRESQPRMPWHDVHMCVEGGPIVFDVAHNFIQRWNHHRPKKSKSYPRLEIRPLFGDEPLQGPVRVQALRSLCSWSGRVGVENSIYRAYLHHIKKSKHFIYIENQYFISGTAGGGVQNQISNAILRRIVRAYKNQETFRVFVVLPAHPEGSLHDPNTLYIMKWQYRTINRGKRSLLRRLQKEIPRERISDFITFFCLRSYGFLPSGYPATEQVYVHAKLLIVDDRVAIIGSANINDRSMVGTRDSEIALLVDEDKETVDSSMNGTPYKASKFVHSLRTTLWKVHLGYKTTSEDRPLPSLDPISKLMYRREWLERGTRNSLIYERLFNDIPNNAVNSLREFKKNLRRKKSPTGEAKVETMFYPALSGESSWEQLLLRLQTDYFDKCLCPVKYDPQLLVAITQKIEGHIVLFPLDFLSDSSLKHSLSLHVLDDAIFQ